MKFTYSKEWLRHTIPQTQSSQKDDILKVDVYCQGICCAYIVLQIIFKLAAIVGKIYGRSIPELPRAKNWAAINIVKFKFIDTNSR